MLVSARSMSWREKSRVPSGDEGGEDGFAAAVVEEDLVADEDVAGTEGRGGGDLGDEAVGCGEAAE